MAIRIIAENLPIFSVHRVFAFAFPIAKQARRQFAHGRQVDTVKAARRKQPIGSIRRF